MSDEWMSLTSDDFNDLCEENQYKRRRIKELESELEQARELLRNLQGFVCEAGAVARVRAWLEGK